MEKKEIFYLLFWLIVFSTLILLAITSSNISEKSRENILYKMCDKEDLIYSNRIYYCNGKPLICKTTFFTESIIQCDWVNEMKEE